MYPSLSDFPSLLLRLILLFTSTSPHFTAASSLPTLFKLHQVPTTNVSLEFLDPTLPPALPRETTPKCSVLVLQRDFADAIGCPESPPATANYTQPPECPAPWTRVILELSLSVSDVQKDLVTAVWINGAEVLRTTTPLPTSPGGAFWKVHKDITRYSALLSSLGDNGTVSVMLENNNNNNNALPGVFSANVSLHFYRGAVPVARPEAIGTAHPTVKGFYREPADLIIPISCEHGAGGGGFWFQVNNDSHVPAASVAIPRNTYRAVIEIFGSYHADDEFWYTNPLRSSSLQGKLGMSRANGGFRQLYATIDGKFVGGHIPFAVIYPGSINPYFWSPVTAIGAFDIPSYDLDITPFLGLLLDEQPHEIGLGVRDSQPYWLLSGNLHLWVDAWSDVVEAGLLDYSAPPLQINRQAEWRNLDGQSEVDAEGHIRFSGWVSSSKGNITTTVRQKVKFKSQVEVQNRGAVKQVEMINKERTTVGVTKGNQAVGRVQLFVEAPLQVQTSRVNAVGGAVFQKTRLYHQLQEIVILNENMPASTSALTDRQDAEGSVLMHDGAPVWGSGSTRSSYKYRDENTCYLRTVNAAGGAVKFDVSSPQCSAVAVA